jgi:hypothetical protein
MNLQHAIHQHPYLLPLVFPMYFVSIWLVVGMSVSRIGGWWSLAKVYRTQDEFHGDTWRWQSGQMRYCTNYNRALTIGSSAQGLYLSSMFLVRFMHPPLLVPWSEIKVQKNNGWLIKYVTFSLGHELAVPLKVRESLAAKIKRSAGSYWPIEEM